MEVENVETLQINHLTNYKKSNTHLKVSSSDLKSLKVKYPPLKNAPLKISNSKEQAQTSSSNIKALDPNQITLNPLDPTHRKKRKHLNPRLAAILLIGKKIYQIDKGIFKKIDNINKTSDLKQKILKLMPKLEDKDFEKKLTEEDKEILDYLKENEIKFKTKEEAQNHFDKLSMDHEMEHIGINKEFSDRKSISNIGFAIIREKIQYSRPQ